MRKITIFTASAMITLVAMANIPRVATMAPRTRTALHNLSTKIKRLITSIILCFMAIAAMAQGAESPSVQMLEGEIRAGLTTPLGGYHTGKAQVSGTLGLEGRYNFKGTPWDCGLMLDLSTARRGYEHLYNDGYDRWQNNRSLALAATSEYNFRQGTKINPFAGTALGIAFNDVVGDKYFPSKGISMIFAPRVGVEFLYHIRLMAQFNICRKGYNNFSLTLGFVIGGRPKRHE